MIVYYRRETERDKDGDKIRDRVYFGTTKRKFHDRVFLELPPATDQKERLKFVAEILGKKEKQITLTKWTPVKPSRSRKKKNNAPAPCAL